MKDYRELERRLMQNLKLQRRPLAVTFREHAPEGVTRFTGSEPSGCSFWRLASAGRVFYTVPEDHHNCPIGSYTHNFPLPAERAEELDRTLSMISGLGYLHLDEIPQIPRFPFTPGVVIYAPLADTPVDPDVVLLAGLPGRIMLLQESALRARVRTQIPALSRPTCLALPAAMSHGMVASTGCIGNRVYTDLGEDELYVAIAGRDLSKVTDSLDTILAANEALLSYHQERRQSLATE